MKRSSDESGARHFGQIQRRRCRRTRGRDGGHDDRTRWSRRGSRGRGDFRCSHDGSRRWRWRWRRRGLHGRWRRWGRDHRCRRRHGFRRRRRRRRRRGCGRGRYEERLRLGQRKLSRSRLGHEPGRERCRRRGGRRRRGGHDRRRDDRGRRLRDDRRGRRGSRRWRRRHERKLRRRRWGRGLRHRRETPGLGRGVGLHVGQSFLQRHPAARARRLNHGLVVEEPGTKARFVHGQDGPVSEAQLVVGRHGRPLPYDGPTGRLWSLRAPPCRSELCHNASPESLRGVSASSSRGCPRNARSPRRSSPARSSGAG